MKVLLVLLLAGFALAAATPLYDLDQVGDIEEFVDDLDYFSEDKPTLEEVKAKLKEKFDNFLEKVRDAFKGGKDIKEEVLKKGKEIKEKLKLLKEQLDKNGKDYLKNLEERGRDYLKKLLEKLGVNEKRAMDYHVEAIMAAEEKGDMIQKLKDRFKDVVAKVKDAIDKGKNLKDGLETLEKIRQKLKDFNIDLGDFGNEYLDQLKDKVKDYWKKLKDRLGVSKRNLRTEGSIDVVEMIHDFKKLINEESNPEKIKAFVEKYVGDNKELVEGLTQLIQENGKENPDKIKDFLRKLISNILGTHKSSVKEVSEEIRDFFKDLKIKIEIRFAKFGEWVKERYHKRLDKSQSKIHNIKDIAKELLEDTKKISKDVAEEALGFFKQYREDLGIIFDDIEVKVKEILKRD